MTTPTVFVAKNPSELYGYAKEHSVDRIQMNNGYTVIVEPMTQGSIEWVMQKAMLALARDFEKNNNKPSAKFPFEVTLLDGEKVVAQGTFSVITRCYRSRSE